jgi:hypothetical protein
MDNLYQLQISVAIFFLLIAFIQVLKRQGIFKDEHKPVFNRIITELVLPFTIFSTLATATISGEEIAGAVIMFGSILTCCFLAYVICRILKFSSRITGSIVLLSGFGSTSTLAYPLISQTYGADSQAMALGIVIGEFGVCIPFFTIGVIIASYFGSRAEGQRSDIVPVILDFMRSPIFIAFILGLIFSQIPPAVEIMNTGFAETFFGYFKNALEMMVAISVGLMLRPIGVREILPILGVVFVLKMILLPLLVFFGAGAAGLSSLAVEILVIEAAVPSGAVAAAIADRHGCDGQLASAVIIATYLISLVTIPLISFLIL